MKINSAFVLSIWLFVLGVASCVNTPVERKEATVGSLTDTRKDLTNIRAQIDKTLGSLNALLSAPQDKLKKTYKQYARDVDSMRANAAAMQRHANTMGKHGENYLVGWQRAQAEVKNPELSELSGERRELVAARFKRINAAFQEANHEFVPFLSNLEDIKKVVGNDLTPAGVAAVGQTTVVANATRHGSIVARTLDEALTEFNLLAGVLSPPAK